jgi:hypothetical protein
LVRRGKEDDARARILFGLPQSVDWQTKGRLENYPNIFAQILSVLKAAASIPV